MPNQFIMLMTDSTRYDMIGCYGNPDMKTPNIDNLAKNGIRFDRAYSTQPVCGPARSAIFTGMFPHSNGVVSNCLALGANVRHIGKRLADKNITAAYIGKWHLDGGDYFGLGLCPEGFDKDYWYDMKNYLDELTEDERIKSRKASSSLGEGIDENFTFGYRVTTRALDFIEKNKSNDYLLVVSYDEPHGPFLCPPKFANMFNDYEFPVTNSVYDNLDNKPFYQKVWAGNELGSKRKNFTVKAPLFFGANSFADYLMGKIIDKAKIYAKDATFLYTSDHGDALGAHRLSAKGPCVYDEIARIPFIISGKEVKSGKVAYSPTSHIDIMPTIMDYFNLDIPKVLEGKSMLKQLKNPEIATNDVVFCEFTRYETDHDGFGGLQMMRAAIDNNYKLALHLCDTDEMYSLKDKSELNNLINDKTLVIPRNKLHDDILNMMNKTRDTYRGYQWSNRPWRDYKSPNWGNDGFTRQRVDLDYEPMQLDYSTGLAITEDVRKKH